VWHRGAGVARSTRRSSAGCVPAGSRSTIQAIGRGSGPRGLLHAWDDTAAGGSATDDPAAGGSAADTAAHAIIHATEDDAWRVREMAAKVIAKHHVGEALDAVAGLRDDPVPRVRAAAHRAVVTLTAKKS
jgi:HEAT repeat protein